MSFAEPNLETAKVAPLLQDPLFPHFTGTLQAEQEPEVLCYLDRLAPGTLLTIVTQEMRPTPANNGITLQPKNVVIRALKGLRDDQQHASEWAILRPDGAFGRLTILGSGLLQDGRPTNLNPGVIERGRQVFLRAELPGNPHRSRTFVSMKKLATGAVQTASIDQY